MSRKMIDLRGHHYGKLTAICPVGRGENGGVVWLWKCDCKQTKIAPACRVRKGDTRSCGCIDVGKGRKTTVSVDKRYGFLVVTKKIKERGPHGERLWMCKCDCGKYKKVGSNGLHKGSVRSCGCWGIANRQLSNNKLITQENVTIDLVNALCAYGKINNYLTERQENERKKVNEG